MTGYTRTGKCDDLGSSDAGSHHVCVKMTSDFCLVLLDEYLSKKPLI